MTNAEERFNKIFTSTETRRLVRTDSPGRPPRLTLTQLLNYDTELVKEEGDYIPPWKKEDSVTHGQGQRLDAEKNDKSRLLNKLAEIIARFTEGSGHLVS